MQLDDLGLLKCVDCGGAVSLARGRAGGGALRDAVVACDDCGRSYPVLDGVGVFFRRAEALAHLSEWELAQIRGRGFDAVLEGLEVGGRAASPVLLASSRNWDFQHRHTYDWRRDLGSGGYHDEQSFWRFLGLDPTRLRGAVVYAVGVGSGKDAFHALHQRPAKLVANELGPEAHDIPNLLDDTEHRLLTLRFDAAHPPLQDGFADVVLCDHVLQHVEDRERAFAALAAALKPGGVLALCVYSHENNGLMLHGVEPLRAVTRRLPLRAVFGLSLAPAAAVHALVRGLYRPLAWARPRLAEQLPLYEHMMFWSQTSLDFLWTSIFDLLHAPVSHHFTRDELEALVRDHGLEIERLANTHGTLWTLVAGKPAS